MEQADKSSIYYQRQLGSENLPGICEHRVASLIKKPVWIEPSGQILPEMKFSALF